MAKGDQHKQKMVKKPKKDAPPPKAPSADRPTASITAVIPRGKVKLKGEQG